MHVKRLILLFAIISDAISIKLAMLNEN